MTGEPTRVNWSYVFDQRVDSDLQSSVNAANMTEGGNLVHDWIETEFSDEFDWMDFEGKCENGRYDAYDGTCVYEFKTKHPNVFGSGPPYDRDIEQIKGYLEAGDIDPDFGILVYLNRGDLTEVKEYLVNDGVVRLE